MDVNMPVMDGLESTTKIQQMFKEHVATHGVAEGETDISKTPIAALTANDTNAERQKCKDAGMTFFLSKPPEINDLKSFLKQVFGDEMIDPLRKE